LLDYVSKIQYYFYKYTAEEVFENQSAFFLMGKAIPKHWTNRRISQLCNNITRWQHNDSFKE